MSGPATYKTHSSARAATFLWLFVASWILLATALSACSPATTQDGTNTTDASAENAPIDASAKDSPSDAPPAELPSSYPPDQITRCNGHASLCERTYDKVVFPATHNAMSNREENWGFPNQEYGIKRQLDDGIRAMLLDTHYYQGESWLCHGTCEIGKLPLVEGLQRIRLFLDQHPFEVFSILFESKVSAEDTAKAVEDSGLLRYLYAHPIGTPWPTLRTMLASQKRVVIFTQSGGGSPSWYHPLWKHAWDNPYAAKEAKDLKCSASRGQKSNPLFLLNHFLTNPLPAPKFAEEINRNPFFLQHVQSCVTLHNRLPTFIAVDFYSIGDLFAVVNTLNKVP